MGGRTIRVVEIDGEPWFFAPDVCRALSMDTINGVHKYTANLASDEKGLTTRRDHPELFRGSRTR